MENVIDKDTRIRVSSTLDKSVGKKFLTDGSPETCWTSQQGTPQFIHLTFASPVKPKTLHITFQGGFVGKRSTIYVLYAPSTPEAEHIDGADEGSEQPRTLQLLTTVYPEDVNRKQSFTLPGLSDAVEQMKIVFEESSDFFGRITIYDLQVEGEASQELN